MDFSFILILALTLPILILIGYVVIKTFITKKIPDSRFTPFDSIMGQSAIEFHQEKEEKEQDEDEGDDKEKNASPPR